ncbi:efflux RND transporter periplasmic adaptor subunit [Psychrobacter sp. FDAARGOS_221]|uniref:efflux RND transporter periplasmic adaptor subunit n=1 Tax=Psychrobacter sp. FDAARGOS_221 TaxID=1975705 RepID=UPI000BB56226|nr:efflux RND transporter periplasmic adaptor subunit [Psychrobacter sp. FDAARGOS_221]PNK61326.1 efflux transporter periplasmic adaptor subunit [Psychrobacter sp. FDAARGOS_221]
MALTSNKFTRKSLIKWTIIALVVIALAVLAYNKFKPKEEAINYITSAAEIGDIENNVMASGKVKALNTVDVGAQVSGEVTRLYVDVGDEVKKGDLIAQIDQVTQKNNLSNQQASLEQSRAAVESAQADYQSRQASLQSAQADLKSRQAELKQAQADYARLQPLVAKQAISEQELDAARTTMETAAASVDSAKAAIKTAQAALITAKADIASTRADLQKAQTNVDTASTDLGYTTIRAPMDGTVVAVVTEQGTTVNANQSAPTIVTLADLSTVRINAQISEADVINVQAGMPVYFNTIGNPDQKYDAVLTAIEPAPEQISDTSSTDSAIYYVGYIEVPNPERRFRIDMTAQVYVVVDKAENALLIPSAALKKGPIPANTGNSNDGADSNTASNNAPNNDSSNNTASAKGNGTYVRVLDAEGNVESRPVTVGIDNRVNAQILSGLKQGEQVIISENSGDQAGGANSRRRIPGM